MTSETRPISEEQMAVKPSPVATLPHVFVHIACPHCEHVNYLKTRFLSATLQPDIFGPELVPFHLAADLANGPPTCNSCHDDFSVVPVEPQFMRVGAMKYEPARGGAVR